MKKKYLKKMLAIMLASMTVAATPGLVGAMKGESRKAIGDANSKIKSHTLTIEEATNMLNDLEKMANEDDEAKKEVANTLGDMIHEGLFGKTSHHNDHMLHFNAHMCSPENLSKIIKIFKTCSTSDIAKRSTAWAIGTMAREGLLGKAPSKSSSLLIPQCSPENFSDVIDILEQCLEYKDSSVKKADYFKAKQHVSNSILQMAGQGVLGKSNTFLHMFGEEPFRKCPPEQTSRIMGLLEKCLKDNEETVADDIAYLASRELLGQYPKDKILAMLQECLKNPNAKEAVAQALRICAGNNMLDQNSLRPVLYMLEQCLQSHGAKRSVAPTITFMAEYGVFGRDSLNQILNMLNSCCDDSYDDYFIPRAITNMVETGLINEQTIDNEILVQILQKRSQYRYSRDHVSKAIKVIAQKNLLNQCSPDKLKRIIASLLSCREYNDLSKGNVSEAVQAMADQGILYRCEPNQIREIAGALADCLRGESFRREAINAVMAMNDKDLLNQCDSANIHQLVDALIGCLGSTWTINEAYTAILAINNKDLLNKCTPDQIRQIVGKLTEFLENNDTREKAIATLAAIIRNNNVLNQLTPAELGRLANSLPENLASSDTYEAATVIISAMAENPATFNQINIAQLRQILSSFKTHLGNYLASGNYETVDRIFEVCKKCSEIDDLKADVADIAEMLINHGAFCHYLNQNALNPRLGSFLEIAISCSQTQNVETRKKAVFAIAYTISRAGKTDEATQLTKETIIQIAQKIPQIIEMLEESSTVDEAKLDVSDIINLLGRRGFFQNLSDDQSSRLITALSNCLTYGGELISTRENVNDEQRKIAFNIYSIFNESNIFNENGWIVPFNAGLSDDNKAGLAWVESETWAAVENAQL